MTVVFFFLQNAVNPDPATLAQLQQLHKFLQRQGVDNNTKSDGQPVRFDRKLLDFDYGEDEDEDHANPSPKPASANTNSATGIDTMR